LNESRERNHPGERWKKKAGGLQDVAKGEAGKISGGIFSNRSAN